MIEFILEQISDIYKSKAEKSKEKKIIIDEYLLPEITNNLNELARLKIKMGDVKFDIFDVVQHIEPDTFEVGEYDFLFSFINMDFSSYNEVKDKIKTSDDKDYTLFRKVYKVFNLVEKKDNLKDFSLIDYREFHETIKAVIDYITNYEI